MKLQTPCYIELQAIKDLARLACALERASLPIFCLRLHEDDILAIQIDLLMGRPIIYYAKHGKSGEFLAYRNMGGNEDVLLVDAITNPTFTYAPIIHVEKIPEDMMKKAKADKMSGYISIELKDLASLAKVSSYKMIFEEAPLPLFLFKDRSWILGTFMSMNDNDSISYFYYIRMDSTPAESFLKYSSQSIKKPAFTNKIDEHGYVYMKIIRLSKNHPLVMIHE
ncbi:MAG: hypothetical protein ACE5J2_04365 [Nitrososphaerales archaeon]